MKTMLLASAILFVVLCFVFSVSTAFLLSIFFLGAWMLINYYASNTGLIKINMQAYFQALSAGKTSDEALTYVIQSRYPDSKEKRDYLIDKLAHPDKIRIELRKMASDESFEKLRELIMEIYLFDNGVPPDPSIGIKIHSQIDATYSTMLEQFKNRKASH